MPNAKPANQSEKSASKSEIEELLTGQTSVILQAVDERLAAQSSSIKEELAVQEVRILAAVDKRLEKLEERFMEKLNELTTTLDKFLKRLTDVEQEFKRVKTVIREKLGVAPD